MEFKNLRHKSDSVRRRLLESISITINEALDLFDKGLTFDEIEKATEMSKSAVLGAVICRSGNMLDDLVEESIDFVVKEHVG